MPRGARVKYVGCSVEGCESDHLAKGLCSMHYARQRNWGTTDAVGVGQGKRPSRYPDTCTVPGCATPTRKGGVRIQTGLGMCRPHFTAFKKHGDPLKYVPRPERTNHVDSNGYRVVNNPFPGPRQTGEHRAVMMQHLGRQLVPGENVHHINGDRLDNRLENLELWNTSQPAGQRIPDKVAHALEILALYAPDRLVALPEENHA